MTDIQLKTFKAISDFVADLAETFKNARTIQLYNRLIEKTTFRDTAAIQRHIAAFRQLFDRSTEWSGSIMYSPRVYIDMDWVWSKVTATERKILREHLTVIYTLMYRKSPEIKANVELELPKTNEGDFIKTTLDQITSQISETQMSDNPMEMVSNLMQSGFFNTFVNDLQDKYTSGEININNLVNTVSTMIETTAPDTPEGDSIRNMMGMALQNVPDKPEDTVD